jgi:FAD/FMN-containing dehydrogenase
MASMIDPRTINTNRIDTNKIDWNQFSAAISNLDQITDPIQVAKLSQDYYTFSPILQKQLAGKVADRVVRPTTEAEVLQVAAACVQQQIPLTVRGAGTGNYGQCVPLAGGVILDLSQMNQIHWIKSGRASVEPGVKLAVLDKAARPQGWEMRLAPSTYRTATIGGFIGGGSCGLGSINYGFLSDRGNLLGVRVVTLEPEPQVLALRGDEVQQVNHAYGTNGIITALEIPLAPAYDWAEVLVSFPQFMSAAHFGQALGDSCGIIKKLVTICAWPIPNYFTALKSEIPPNSAVALLLVAESSLEPLADLVREHQGQICYQKSSAEASKGIQLGEYTWNHTTLHARAADPNITYLQTVFPADPSLQLVETFYHHFGEEVMMHLEFVRSQGQIIPAGLQLVRYTSDDRLQEIIQYHEDHGAVILNPHTYILEDGGMKQINPVQVAFKQQVDPNGLLNPGKMRGWDSLQAD